MGRVMDRLSDPRLLVTATVAVLVPSTLVWLSGLDMLVGLMLLFVPLGWGLLLAYGVLSFVRAVRLRRDRWLEQQAVGWAACLLACTVALQLGVLGVPEEVRFRISADALAAAGERVLAGEHPTRAALYTFERTRVEDGCALLTSGLFFISEYGWAYCPDRRLASPAFQHVDGALYTYDFD